MVYSSGLQPAARNALLQRRSTLAEIQARSPRPASIRFGKRNTALAQQIVHVHHADQA